MSAKKGRRAKVPPVPPDKSQDAPPQEPMDSPNLSLIDKASFLEGLQVNYGNPLHSTAMDEDLNTLEDEQMDKGKTGGKAVPETTKTTAKQRGAAVKRKETGKENEKVEGEKKKKKRRSAGENVKARHAGEERKKKKGEPEGEREESDASPTPQTKNKPTPKAKHLVGKKPAKRRSAGKVSAPSPEKKQRMKRDTKRKSESGDGKLSDAESWDSDTDTDSGQQNHRRVLSSDEEVGDDRSWAPSPKKAKVYSFGRTRKSTSDSSKSRKSSSDSAAEKVNTKKQRERRGHQGGTDLEVVLDAFLDFCDQYKESVESKAVQHSIDSFSSSVKEQLLEKISSNKEIRLLRRENAKVGSLIRTKTQRLLDAKHELMRAERQVWLLQKEKAELKLRLSDLRRSSAFLHDLRELNQQYLEHRHTHRKEKETYGASSLPALLLETKHVQTAENQLRSINKEMEKRMKMSGTCKDKTLEDTQLQLLQQPEKMSKFGADANNKTGQVTMDASGYHRKKTAGSSAPTREIRSVDDCYNMGYHSIGTCVIINNKDFLRPENLKTRDGTDVDARSAAETFTTLGYKVKVFKNQTARQMKRLLEDASMEDHSSSASFVCVMLSHGDEGVIYGTDMPVRIQDLTHYFKGARCLSLVGKPKLFFIQACRGDKYDKGTCMVDADLECTSENLPVEADFLYAYSTAPGYLSWRDASTGSWFMQSLCEMLQLHYGQLELMQIMVRVNRMVAYEFEAKNNPKDASKKQMPCIVMMLTKELYFTK